MNPALSAGGRPHVVSADGSVRRVTNLGWLLNHWKSISEFTWESTHGGSGVFRAEMRDGAVYTTDYADFGVFLRFVNRSIFRGLPIRIDGRKYVVGDAEFKELAKSGNPSGPGGEFASRGETGYVAWLKAGSGFLLGGGKVHRSTPFSSHSLASDWLHTAVQTNRDAGRDVASSGVDTTKVRNPEHNSHEDLSDLSPAAVAETFEEHLEIVSTPEFQDAPPETQAAILTAQDYAGEVDEISKDTYKRNPSHSRYEVVPYRVWENNQGRQVSFRGAAPYHSAAQKEREGWEVVQRGWTIFDKNLNTCGIGRTPFETKEQAEAWVAEKTGSNPIGGKYDRCLSHVREHGGANEYAVCSRLRGNPHDEQRELELFIDNDSALYRQQYEPILKNLATKKARGVYDHSKAVKLFMYLMESGAKKYVKEYGSSGGVWHKMFSTSDRKEVAEAFTRHFETEYDLGNYDRLLPKKYQKKGNSRMSNPESTAADLSETFHGRPSEEVTEVIEQVHYHENLADLGTLTCLRVHTESGYSVDIKFAKPNSKDEVKLASSEDGTSLYIVGGDQSLDLSSIHMGGDKWRKDVMVIGRIKEIEYYTSKAFDNFVPTVYYHKSREGLDASGTRHKIVSDTDAVLLYRTRDEAMEIAGGQAVVKDVGIVG